MATQHKEIDAQTLENLLYLSRLSPESTDMETLKKQVDEIVGYPAYVSHIRMILLLWPLSLKGKLLHEPLDLLMVDVIAPVD